MSDKTDSNIADNSSDDMVEESKMGGKYADPDLFPADRIISKMGDNLAKSEALIDDTPLRTEKTAEVEEKDCNDENDSQNGE